MPENAPELLSKSIAIGRHVLANRVILAPMSGVTDVPFRRLASEYGAGLVVSEMIASQALLEGEAEMQLKLLNCGSPLHMVQIAGRETKWMGLAAKMAGDSGADIIDINMGCPARRVTTGYSGSALMRDLDHALKLIEAVVKAVETPVTLKMRLGWDDQSINAPELARRATDAGVQMITVHGRTRCQFYRGKADWRKVSEVRDASDLPLVVNGDIVDIKGAESALDKSGADAVMIGRGAYGAPWKPAEIAGTVAFNEAFRFANNPEIAIRHHEDMLGFYGVTAGIKQARKHLSWYISNLRLPSRAGSMRGRILTSVDAKEIAKLLVELYQMADPIQPHSQIAA